jgi:SWI/SNF-related matrix-associated actin-dependent regulator of chromatin subfamily A member 5
VCSSDLEYQFFPKQLRDLQDKEQKLYDRSRSFLSKEELDRKEELYNLGFIGWTKKDFYAYVKACESVGRGNVEEICSILSNKNKDEVKRYHNTFWERYKEITEHEKIVAQLTRAEAKAKRHFSIKNILSKKYSSGDPNFRLFYSPNTRSKHFSELADKAILFNYFKHLDESDCYDSVIRALRRDGDFKFDYYVKTRTPLEIQRRVNVLCGNLLKFEDNETNGGEE